MNDSSFAPPSPLDGESTPSASDSSAPNQATEPTSTVLTDDGQTTPGTADAAAAAGAHQSGSERLSAVPTPVGRLRKRSVALISIGALGIGLLGGVGGAWAFQEWAPSSGTALPAASSQDVDRPAGSVSAIATAAMPSVVSIESTSGGSRVSTGSGFIIREDGYILTNNHVVESADGGSVSVLMSDGSVVEGTVVGTTPEYDLAVVKIDETGLTPLVLGDSDSVVVGDEAIAVGSPLGLDSTVTTGIISALHRPVTAGGTTSAPAYIDAIQTDAAINPGNSGGPLINSAGEVIGINSAIATVSGSGTETAGSVGLGFAIPSNQARRTADQLIEDGVATFPVIGVLLDQTYTGEGIKVVDDASGVIPDGPADLAGIEPGDVITQIDGRPVTRSDELVVAIRAKAPGDDVALTVKHEDSEKDVTVSLASSADVALDREPAPQPSQ